MVSRSVSAPSPPKHAPFLHSFPVWLIHKDARLEYDAGDTATPQIPDKATDDKMQEVLHLPPHYSKEVSKF